MRKAFVVLLFALLLPLSANAAMCPTGTYAFDPDVEPTNYTYSAANMTWEVTAPYGTLSGIAVCNSTSGSWASATSTDFPTGTSGVYCWCKMTSPATSAWVYLSGYSSASVCDSDCAHACGGYVRSSSGFRGGVFGSACCDAGYINTGASCEPEKFSVTTTFDTTSFSFTMSAIGTFYVDWGDGNTQTITRSDTTNTQYSHNYSSAASYTIRFGGGANTGYSYYTDFERAAISFYTSTRSHIRSVSGSLGALFPQFGNNEGQFPRFYMTFYEATNLITIPGTLFSGLTGGGHSMFYLTFGGCTGLTTLPATLFSSITDGAGNLFGAAFLGCSGLTSIPTGLFSNISSPGAFMFSETFRNCTSLTSIPANLFSGITSAADTMFDKTFYGCTSLSGYIPPSAFAGLVANGHPTASNMWYNTFYDTNVATSCSSYNLPQYITGYESEWSKVSCGCDSGYAPTSNNTCEQLCTAGVTGLHTSTGLVFNLYANRQTQPSIYIQPDNSNTVCYVNLAPGVANNAVNVEFNGAIYHSTD